MAPGLLEPENLTWVGLWGGGIVVVGSMLSALGGGTGERPPAA
jgi:hypothetical protein